MASGRDEESHIKKLRENLEKAKANDEEYKKVRLVILDALSQGQTTEDGQSQDAKLEIVDKALLSNLEVMFDIEAILASKGKLYECMEEREKFDSDFVYQNWAHNKCTSNNSFSIFLIWRCKKSLSFELL